MIGIVVIGLFFGGFVGFWLTLNPTYLLIPTLLSLPSMIKEE